MSDTTAIQIPRCHICGCSPPHAPAACPLVESVEYHQNGAVAKITKRQPNEGWAARAAATPDPPAANPWRNINVNHLPSVKLRDAWDDGWAAHAAASPDERLREAGVWPDQSAMHGVLLDQIKDAYAEGIADTIDRIRVRAAEMLPEVARFTLDEIEALAAADREKPDEPIHQPDPVAADLGHPEVPDATTPEES